MKKLLTTVLFAFLIIACSEKQTVENNLINPDKTIRVHLNLNTNNQLFYQVFHNNKMILDTSYLGLIREDSNFYSDLQLTSISQVNRVKEKYSMLHGKQKDILYQANQYNINLKNKDGKSLQILFNLSNDGVAFKYNFPETSKDIKYIKEEKTTYNFVNSTKAWLQPMSKAKTGWSNTNPSYEEHYQQNIDIETPSPIGEGWVYPALFNTNNTWTLISESGLDRTYCGTRLKYNKQVQGLQVTFPQDDEIFPKGALNPESTLPWSTPWRTITIGSLKTITESTLGIDVALPSRTTDIDFIKPGVSSWSWVLLKDDFTTYETSIKFIDYAARMHWSYCLIDADWDRKIGIDKMEELVRYAKTKGVKILVWYNSSGSWNTTPYTPKDQLLTNDSREKTFKKLNDIGVAGVKIDFFGGDGQSMIAYYHDILESSQKHKLLVNFHGATLPRGWQRTYPNLLTAEAIMGEEFITFVQENADAQPSHCAMLPFTRNVFDPMDFTPMVLDTIPNIKRITTKGFELALPVLFTSGIQHIAETPEGMNKQPEFIIDYLKDIPTLWEETKFIDGFPGKDVVIARRKGNQWYIVGINGENKLKELDIDLSFIDRKEGVLFSDGKFHLEQQTLNLDQTGMITITMKPYGGFTMKF